MNTLGPRELSLCFVLFNILIMFCMLFQSKYPPKKTWVLTLLIMGLLSAFNMVGFALFGVSFMAKSFLITCTVPSWMFFFAIAKKRNGQFFFTFCLVDIYAIWIMSLTYFMAVPFGNNEYILLISRMILFALSDILIYRYIKKPYQEMLQTITNSWWLWAVISVLIYAVLGLMLGWPSPINERPEEIPAFVLILILLPLAFASIFRTIRFQVKWVQTQSNEMIFKLQAESLKKQQQQIEDVEQKRKIERHDFRHTLQNIHALLIANGNHADAIHMIEQYMNHTDQTIAQQVYCDNTVINAILNYNIENAHKMNIITDVKCDLSAELNIDEIGFSTVMANAFENACNACGKLPVKERIIHVMSTVNSNGVFIFEMKNPYEAAVEFDSDGIPLSNEEGHGIGTRSIVAFANKYGAHISYEADGHMFIFRILINQ